MKEVELAQIESKAEKQEPKEKQITDLDAINFEPNAGGDAVLESQCDTIEDDLDINYFTGFKQA